jgi:transposase
VSGRKRRRSFARAFKLSVLKRMAETENILALAAELGVERRLLYCWRDALASGGEEGLRRAGRPSLAERAEAALSVSTGAFPLSDPTRRVAELERKIGEQQVALDFFRAALRQVGERRRKSGGPGAKTSTP